MVMSALNLVGAKTLLRAFSRLVAFVAMAGAAFRCAAAVENGYKPERRDLAALGIGDVMAGPQYIGR